MMTNDESTEIVSFITTGAGGLVPGCGLKSHIVKMHYFFQKLLLYFGGYMKKIQYFSQTQKDTFDDVPVDSCCINRFYCSCLLPLFYDGAVHLKNSQCTVSDTQVTIKAHGPLVLSRLNIFSCICIYVLAFSTFCNNK